MSMLRYYRIQPFVIEVELLKMYNHPLNILEKAIPCLSLLAVFFLKRIKIFPFFKENGNEEAC